VVLLFSTSSSCGRSVVASAASTQSSPHAPLRNDLILVDEVGFAPLDDTGAQLLFRFVSAAYERRSLGIASHWPFDQWGRFLPEHTTAVSLLDRLLHHASVVVTSGDSYRMRQARAKGGTTLKEN
jgi:DNA replication protein DnaC